LSLLGCGNRRVNCSREFLGVRHGEFVALDTVDAPMSTLAR
jgi:hypothetical protein